MSFPRRRESRTQEQTGFLLEFIPMEIGAGMTEKNCSERASSFGRSPGRGLGAYPEITFPPFVKGGEGGSKVSPPDSFLKNVIP